MDEQSDGTLGLVVLYTGQDPEVDIVAVHGLGASPSWAWVRKVKDEVTGEERKVNWLKDRNMLPSDIPNARIMTFNYESKWIKDAPKQGRFSCAEQLLTALDNQRQQDGNTRNRPILFIGHSYGGIVIEQALVNAIVMGSPFMYLANSTVGVVFLGTPHRGSPSSKWGEILVRCGRVLGLGGNDRILKDLNDSSEVLADLVYPFTIWLFRMSVEVFCFYEQHETDYGERFGAKWRDTVVEEKSACLDGHRKLGLPTDHLKINKFAGQNDPSYKYVYPVIQQMISKGVGKIGSRLNPHQVIQDDSRIPGDNQPCQNALSSGTTYPPYDLEKIRRLKGRRVEGTCEWLLVQEKYSEWLVGNSIQLLRLVGAPGIGKTMLSSFLVDEIEKKATISPEITFVYYFCDNKDAKRNTATSILRGLLVQLMQQHPRLFKYIQPKYDRIGDDLFNNIDALWLMFKEIILKEFSGGGLHLLIDAIDECEKTSRLALLPKFIDLSNENINVKIIVTCRPEPDIEDAFRGKKGSLYIHLDHINSDLSKFIDVRVKQLVERKGWREKQERIIKEALNHNADGTFLWASLILEDISTVIHIPSITGKLRDLPQSLRDVYTTITDTIGDADTQVARLILQIIVGARRPLTVSELATAYVLAPSSPEKWVGNTVPPPEYLDDFRDSFKCCGLLIYHDEETDTINLIHQSAKEYLLSQYLQDSKKQIQNDTRLVNRFNLLLLEICCIYLGMKDFDYLSQRMVFQREWAIDWEAQWWEVETAPIFLSYAGWGWEAHAVEAENIAVEELHRITQFLKKRQTVLDSWLRRAAFCGKEDFTRWLLSSAANVNAEDFRGWTPLQIAAKSGNHKSVMQLIENGASVNTPGGEIGGRTALQAAAGEGHAEIVKDLLDTGANVNAAATNIDGRTALQAAAERGHIQIVVQLLKAGANVNAPAGPFQGMTALMAAGGGEYEVAQRSQPEIEARHDTIVALLFEAGANPNIADSEGWTALHAAAERGSLPMVSQILKFKDIDVNKKARFAATALLTARERRHQSIISRLADAGAKGEYSPTMIDFDADWKFMKALLSRVLVNGVLEVKISSVTNEAYPLKGRKYARMVARLGGGGGGLTYACVEDFLDVYLSMMFDFLNTCRSDCFLMMYIREWKLYKRAGYHNSRWLKYLNGGWIRREILYQEGTRREVLYGEMRLNKIDELHPVYNILELHLVLWRRQMPDSMVEKLAKAVQKMKETESAGGTIDRRQIVDLYDSLGERNSKKPDEKLDELRCRVGEWHRFS